MIIQLMKNYSENERVVKNTEVVSQRNGYFRDDIETDIQNPEIVIEGNISDYVDCNYLYIPDYGKYYFIEKKSSIVTNLFSVLAREDVLSTFADSIYEQKAVIARQENEYNLYLDDGIFRTYSDPIIQTKAFPSGFNTQEFVLVIAGGQ